MHFPRPLLDQPLNQDLAVDYMNKLLECKIVPIHMLCLCVF